MSLRKIRRERKTMRYNRKLRKLTDRFNKIEALFKEGLK